MSKTTVKQVEQEAKKRAKKTTTKKQTKSKKSSSIIPTTKASVACSIPYSNIANKITPDNMLGDPFVYSCIKVLSESLASTPLEIYNKDLNTKAKDFYLYPFLKRKANEEQTPYEVLQWLLIDFYRHNYCIAVCPRDDEGKVIGIYPLPAEEVNIILDDEGNKFYIYKDFVFESSEVLQVINFFDRGVTGTSLLDYQKQTIATSLATEKFAGDSFSKGIFPAGIASVEEGTTLEELQELKQRFKEEFGSSANVGSVLISSALKDYKPFTISNEDAQMLEARKFDRSIIAGLFRVPAHLINDLEKATFSNVEHLDLSFVKHTLRPIAKNFEQRLNLTLLTKAESEVYDISFNFDALMRGDFLSRTSALAQQVQSGLRTINEARELENLSPLPNGDTLRTNASLVEK